jgi:hypothetical protein
MLVGNFRADFLGCYVPAGEMDTMDGRRVQVLKLGEVDCALTGKLHDFREAFPDELC